MNMLRLLNIFCLVLSVLIPSVISQAVLSPWSPLHCELNTYKCGDLCVTPAGRCLCGEVDWNWFDNQREEYCCVPPGGSQCYKDQLTSSVHCPGGQLSPWSQPCHGNQCEGSPLDLSLCPNDCLGGNKTEADLELNLENCADNYGNPGMRGAATGGVCLPNYKWCTEDRDLCKNSPGRKFQKLQRLCQNSTFWDSQDCNIYKTDGIVLSYGERCRGSLQHCVYPPYLNYDFKARRAWDLLSQCKDKSDQIFMRHSQCNMSAHLDIYCDKCLDDRSHFWWKNADWGDCETKCGNKTKFFQEQTDPNKKWKSDQDRNDVLDPHNCQASCLEPGYGCTACENKNYFNCSLSSNCLHPDLVCDGVPQCPPVPPSTEPEDEELERCKEKGVFRSDATMKCQSIFHPEVTIMAVPCNGVPECHKNADEEMWKRKCGKEKKVDRSDATMICKSMFHPMVTILAILAMR